MKKKELSRNCEDTILPLDILNEEIGVVSATECTGLMPAPPQNYDEAEAYAQIYSVPKAENKREKELKDHKKDTFWGLM